MRKQEPLLVGKHLKSAATLLILIFCGFVNHKAASIRWVLDKTCSLKVNGSTNVNKFSCVISSYTKTDTLVMYQNAENGPIRISGKMELDVASFDCHHAIMTKDLRKTLKADKYPRLVVEFINLSRNPQQSAKEVTIRGMVAISLAGVKKRFEVEYRYLPGSTSAMTLIGSKQIKFSDFGIIPPRKLGGMIQTNDALAVEFVLKMNQINQIL